jgi:hypothetical protein
MGRVVGGTYGERRQSSVNCQSIEAQVVRHRDFFERRHDAAEMPSANAEFKINKGRNVAPIKTVESGKAHGGTRITDDARVAFLDKIIAGQAENRAPADASKTKIQVKSISKTHIR